MSTSAATLTSLYPLLRPLFLPPSHQFVQPLLDNAVAFHDPLVDDTTVFTARMRMREVGVEVEGVVRLLRREIEELSGAGVKGLLEAVEEGRGRGRGKGEVGGDEKSAKEEALARAKERRRVFDMQMKKEEEEALQAFKEGLRRSVENG